MSRMPVVSRVERDTLSRNPRAVHIFEPPVRVGVAEGRPVPSKRKRETDEEEEEDVAFETDNELRSPGDESGSASPSVIDDEQHNELLQEDLPVDFPHAGFPGDSGHVQLVSHSRNLKRQHFHVLNTILNKCLLDHDYARAGQAFACLLRFEIQGGRIDIRKKGLWGIGAEILLQKPNETRSVQFEDELFSDVRDIENQDTNELPMASPAGFQAARRYYDRLILQYPYRKFRPNDVSAEHFYPAMFSLWIFQVQSQGQRARRALQQSSNEVAIEAISVNGSGSDAEQRATEADERRIRSTELRQAREIGSALHSLTLSPPFDRDARILKLHGRVSLWISDLLVLADERDELEQKELEEAARRSFWRARAYGARLSDDELEICDHSEGTNSPSV